MAINQSDLTTEQELADLVACTLSDNNLKTQRERWINVGTNFGIGRERTDDGLQLTASPSAAFPWEASNRCGASSLCGASPPSGRTYRDSV